MPTEYEHCTSLSDKELVDRTRSHPMAKLLPCVTVLLERFEVHPEKEPERKRCDKCCGTGKSGVAKTQTCKSCDGTGLDLN